MLCSYLVCLEPGYSPDPRRFKNITENTDKFFRKPINDSLEVWSAEGADGWEVRLIRFFEGAQCRVVACALKTDAMATDYLSQPKNLERKRVDSDNAIPAPNEIASIDAAIGRVLGRMAKFDYSVRSRVVWLKGDLDTQIWQASHFLRSSATLTAHLFEDVNHTSFVADAKGVAVVDKSFDSEIRAKNLLMVVALSCAYQAVLNDAIEALAIAGSGGDGKAIPEIRKWSKFLAAYYFKEPVRATTVELIHLYSKIRDRQRISEQYEEATDQLRLLSDLAQIERSEHIADATSSKAAWLAFGGVIAGVLGVLIAVLGLVQVTPKVIIEFKSAWGECGANGGVGWACVFPKSDSTAGQPVTPPKVVPKKHSKKSPTE